MEGGEGSGKTEQGKYLKQYLEEQGREVVLTREPGGVKIAEKIRHILLNPSVKDMDAMTEVLLYAAARREHLLDVILPSLEQGKVVLSDRYFDSSIVYQGMVKGIGWQEVLDINLKATSNTVPDMTLLLDIKPEIAVSRIFKDAEREKNRFDNSSMTFHKRVRKGYLLLADLFPERFRIIDANDTRENVALSIQRELSRMV